MEKRFGFLRAVSIILKILAALVFIAGLVLAVIVTVSSNQIDVSQFVGRTVDPANRVAAIVAVLFSGVFSAFFLMVTANQIDLTLAVEENTRATALLVRRLVENQRDRI